jgi:hypothetical protein
MRFGRWLLASGSASRSRPAANPEIGRNALYDLYLMACTLRGRLIYLTIRLNRTGTDRK